MSALAPAMQAYFTDRLVSQRGASPNTIAAYCQTFRLLLALRLQADRQAAQRAGHRPARRAADRRVPGPPRDEIAATASAPATTASRRSTRCSPTSRCTTPSTPPRSSGCSRSRTSGPSATSSPTSPSPRSTRCWTPAIRPRWTGRRDHAMLALTIQTGLRISELAGLTCADITLSTGANVHTLGKGRKERRTPLIPATRKVLKAWLKEARRRPRRPAVPDDHRQAPQPRRDRTTPRPPPRHRRGELPVAQGQARDDAHAPPHRRDAPPARRQRRHRDRPLARPRADLHDEHLPPRRHDPQATSDRPHQTPRRQTRPLPAPRHAPEFLEDL